MPSLAVQLVGILCLSRLRRSGKGSSRAASVRPGASMRRPECPAGCAPGPQAPVAAPIPAHPVAPPPPPPRAEPVREASPMTDGSTDSSTNGSPPPPPNPTATPKPTAHHRDPTLSWTLRFLRFTSWPRGACYSRYRYYFNLTAPRPTSPSSIPRSASRNAWLETSILGDYLNVRVG